MYCNPPFFLDPLLWILSTSLSWPFLPLYLSNYIMFQPCLCIKRRARSRPSGCKIVNLEFDDEGKGIITSGAPRWTHPSLVELEIDGREKCIEVDIVVGVSERA